MVCEAVGAIHLVTDVSDSFCQLLPCMQH